jgi:hypothetical protein
VYQISFFFWNVSQIFSFLTLISCCLSSLSFLSNPSFLIMSDLSHWRKITPPPIIIWTLYRDNCVYTAQRWVSEA